jgi:uncharacterized protein
MKGEHVAIVAVLDGCPVKSIKKAKTPFIDAISKKGSISYKCKSVYPTATYTAHCSLITGKLPGAHGVVGNSFYDKSSGKIIDFDLQDVNDFVGSKTIFEKVDGTTASIGEPITRGAGLVIPKNEVQSITLKKQNHYAIEKTIGVINEILPRLVVINFTAVDTIGEKYGPESRELLKALEEIDGLIEKLARFLGERYKDHLLILTADHGMTSVRENIKLDELLEDYSPIICPSHRFAHVYLERKNLRRARRLLESDGRFEAVLTRGETKGMGLYNSRTGDLVVFAKRGYELGGQKLRGSHGGVAAEEINVPLIVNKSEYHDSMAGASITIVPSLVLRYLVEKEAEILTKRMLRGVDPSHGWSHTERVLGVATELAIYHKADVQAVRLACILHDAERGRIIKDHASAAAKLAREFLKSRNLPKEKIRKVVHAIRLHHASSTKLETLEEKILWDTDKLDALGLVGLARCLQEAGHLGQSIENAITHLKKDTLEFKNRMHFEETNKIAKQKSTEVEGVIGLLKRELSTSNEPTT